MIIKPRLTDEALDRRLSSLVDRELAERLVAANPELYKHLKERGDVLPAFVVALPDERVATVQLVPHRTRRPGYLLVAVALVAFACLFVLALVARERLGSGYVMVPSQTKPAPPAKSPSAARHQATAQRGAAIPTSSQTRARASAAIEAAAAARAQHQATRVRAALGAALALPARPQAGHAQPQAQPKHTTTVARANLTQTHPAARLSVGAQAKTQPAQSAEATNEVPVWAAAGSASQASASGADTGGGTTPVDPKYPGRETPNGPIWGEGTGNGGHAGDIVLGGTGGGGEVMGGGNCSPSRGGLMMHGGGHF